MGQQNITAVVSESAKLDELIIEARITNELTRQTNELITKNTKQLKVMNERQSNENKIGFWFTMLMLMIAAFAFYVEIVKLDDVNIILDRTESFINSVNPWGGSKV